MNEEKGYQGWANYETWSVNLWINNDQGLQEYYLDLARESESTSDLADLLKENIEGDAPEIEASMYSDLLNAAMSEIDYYEIAEALIAEAKAEE